MSDFLWIWGSIFMLAALVILFKWAIRARTSEEA
jgi:hypothetical protein